MEKNAIHLINASQAIATLKDIVIIITKLRAKMDNSVIY